MVKRKAENQNFDYHLAHVNKKRESHTLIKINYVRRLASAKSTIKMRRKKNQKNDERNTENEGGNDAKHREQVRNFGWAIWSSLFRINHTVFS